MKNFFASLRRTLTKISVFYQILFIIILMVGFMVWQSISSNKAMDMIQKNTKTIYDNTAAISAQDSIDIELEVERIRGQYLALLAGESYGGSASQSNLNILFNKIKARKHIDDTTNKRLDETFANIRAIMEKPVSPQNFQALSREVDNLHSSLRFIRNITASINYNLYLDSESFATKLRKSNRRLVVGGVVSISLIGLLIAFSIYIPFKNMVKRVKSLETGDLSEDTIIATGSQEAAEAISGLNEAITGLRGLVTNISSQSLTLDHASVKLSTISSETSTLATEVAKLAERSKQSARSIAELIDEMKAHTDQTVQAMQEEIARTVTSKDLVEKAVITFEEINKRLMNTIAEINLIAKSTEQMAALNVKATDAITAISAISEQNLASAEEVSAVTEEQSAAMEQVRMLADNLRHIAGSLRQAVEKFILG